MTPRNTAGAADAEAQLRSFIDKFAPPDQRLIRAVRAAVRKRFPIANELVWDNYIFFVIGYSPTERPADSIVSIAARAKGVGLCFIHGARLTDPRNCSLVRESKPASFASNRPTCSRTRTSRRSSPPRSIGRRPR